MKSDFQRGWLKRYAEKYDKIKLYHFFPYNANSLGPLICGGLYFSSPEDFNDPFDCDFKILPTDLEKKFDIDWNDAVADSRKNVLKMGIVCFTPHWDNTLMWAHYADKFYGFCLGYEFDNPLNRNRGIDDVFAVCKGRSYHTLEFWLHEMIYAHSDKYPTKPYFHFGKIEEEMPEAILRYKASDWEYEHECRLSFFGGMGVHPVPGTIKEVYFGLRMGSEEKRVLFTILKKYGPVFYETHKSNTHIKVDRRICSSIF